MEGFGRCMRAWRVCIGILVRLSMTLNKILKHAFDGEPPCSVSQSRAVIILCHACQQPVIVIVASYCAQNERHDNVATFSTISSSSSQLAISCLSHGDQVEEVYSMQVRFDKSLIDSYVFLTDLGAFFMFLVIIPIYRLWV